MQMPSRKVSALLVLLALILAISAWLYSQRVRRVQMATYVPESALGYLELNNWPQTAERLMATDAWQQLAPLYGMDSKRGQALQWAGKLGGWAQYGSVVGNLLGDEAAQAALLTRTQFALVVTGIEVRSDADDELQAIRPRWALLAETHGSASQLQALLAARLPELAERLLGKVSVKASDHAGVAITAFTAANNREHQLLAAQVEGELLLANHLESLQACLDTRLGRAPALDKNFYLQQAQTSVGHSASEITGFITGSGIARLLRFGSYLVAGGAGGPIGKAAVAGAVGDVLTDFTSKAADGLAYSASFEKGAVTDRYALLLKPDLLETLRGAVKVNAQAPRVLELIPASANEASVLTVENPTKVFSAVETAISARVGVAQSFLMRHFISAAQESFFGLKADESFATALGNEVASLNLGTEVEDRIWLLAVRDLTLTRRLVEKILGGAQPEIRQGVEVLHAINPQRGSAAFLKGFVAVGQRTPLLEWLDKHKGAPLTRAPQYLAAAQPAEPGALLNVSATKEAAHTMMNKLAYWLGTSANDKMPAALERLPLATSSTRFSDKALLLESRAPLGSFPALISVLAEARQ